MKRFFSILLVAILVVTTLSTVAAAKEVKPGATVDIEVTVSGEFANYLIDIKADAGLTIKKISGATAHVINSATSAKANWASASNVGSHTVIVTVEVADKLVCGQAYKVTATAQRASKAIAIEQDTDGIVDGLTATSVTVTGGSVSVNHEWDAGKVTTEPTCEGTGVKTITCTICGQTKTETIPAKGHTPGEWKVTKEATCTETGSKEQKCSVCGKVIATETIPAKGHTAGAWVVIKEATCTETGVKEQKCTVCGVVIATETIPMKAHEWGEWTVTKQPTCTEEGEKVRTCKTCTTKKQTEIIPELGHDYVKTAGTATCTEGGWVTYTCTRCGHSYTEEGAAALGHDYKLVDSKAATCTEAGFEKYECSRCKDTYTTELKALGHQWCENFECEHEHEHYDEEYHWFLCLICGEKKDAERHDHCIEKGGYLFCECGHWIEVDEPGIDPEPKPGDYSFVMYAGIAALIAMMAAAAYVYKRKMAN